MTSPVLSVKDLHVNFPSEAGSVSAVRGVDFDLYPGRTLGIVGESGSGKSVTSMSIMGLLPTGISATGEVTVADHQIIGARDSAIRPLRGKTMAMDAKAPIGEALAAEALADRRVGARGRGEPGSGQSRRA